MADAKILYWVSAIVFSLSALWAAWVQVKYPTRQPLGPGADKKSVSDAASEHAASEDAASEDKDDDEEGA